MSEIKIEGNTLREKLENFQKKIAEKSDLSEDDLYNAKTNEGLFKDLAKAFLYGGYIEVINKVEGEKPRCFRIYLHTVEFYFHCEMAGKLKGIIQDPIVYHQNKKSPTGKYPYFPIMTLNAHASGYDITFENEDLGYRASVLIRAYSIVDVKKATETKSPAMYKFDFRERLNQGWFDDRSTYLYDYLNKYSLNGTKLYMRWCDDDAMSKEEPEVQQRKNVYKYEKDGDGYKFDEKKKQYKLESNVKIAANLDPRPWSFSRLKPIELNDIKE